MIHLDIVQLPQKPPQLASVLSPSDRPGENVAEIQVSALLLEPPDADLGMHLLEVAPDHHGGMLLVVQASDDQGAGDGN